MKIVLIAILFTACAAAQQASRAPSRPPNASYEPKPSPAIVPSPPGSSCNACAQCSGLDWLYCVVGGTPACWTDCYAGICDAREPAKPAPLASRQKG